MVLMITISCLFVKSPVFILVIHKPLESLSKTDNRLFVQLSLSFFLVVTVGAIRKLVVMSKHIFSDASQSDDSNVRIQDTN